MKSYYSFFLFLILSTLLFSCKNNMSNDPGVGLGIQPEGDKITITSDTFRIQSANLFVDKIFNRPDSLLLGYYDTKMHGELKYGSLKADILTEFDAPFGENIAKENRLPEGTKVDSVFIILQYSSFFGNKNAPIQVSVYEFNKGQGLDYNKYYPSDIEETDFVDISKPEALIGNAVFTAQKEGTNNKSGLIKIKLKDAFAEKLFDKTKKYADRDAFLKEFKGFYITTNLADATMLNISGNDMILHYHYKAGEETIKNYISYPSNDLTTQINRFEHPDREEVKAELSKEENKKFNYISTPGNIYTTVKLPIRRMLTEMQAAVGKKQLIINSAKLNLNFIKDSVKNAIPQPSEILLVDIKNKDNFATELNLNELYYGKYNSQESILPRYSIDITNLLTEKEQDIRAGKTLPETLEMALIPASFVFIKDQRSNRSMLTGISQMTRITGLTICGGENEEKPMKIDVVYSGF